jgi:hypothetical protein
MSNHEAYNYESDISRLAHSKIMAYLLGRPLQGASAQQVADMLEVNVNIARRHIYYLVDVGKIHLSQPPKATQRGHLPAIYKHGPILRPYIKPGMAYRDLPEEFFKGKTK